MIVVENLEAEWYKENESHSTRLKNFKYIIGKIIQS